MRDAISSNGAVDELAAIRELRILVVDDEVANVALLDGLLRRWGFADVVTTTDPADVVAAFGERTPDIVLLDLHMPGLDGYEVMDLLAPWTRGPTPVPIVVLTADVDPETKRRSLAGGARDFLTKPFDPDEVRLRVGNLLETRRLQLDLKDHGDRLEQRVLERTRELEHARLEVVERLALAAEYRDDDTHHHAQRIGETAARLATTLGLTEQEAEILRRAAPLHDIGKIAIPDSILLKPARLSADEFETIKTHTLIGARILAGSQTPLLQAAERIALSHHERWDGNGYPNGLAGQDIPLGGRIVAVADVFDALTHDRPYKTAWPAEQAIQEIVDNSGSQFDPAVVEAFQSLVERRPRSQSTEPAGTTHSHLWPVTAAMRSKSAS